MAGGKGAWALFIIFFPIVGAVTYTIARPNDAGDYGYEPGYATRPAHPPRRPPNSLG